MPRGSTMSMSFPPFTRAVKQLLIANGAVFLLFALLGFSMHRVRRRGRGTFSVLCLRWLYFADGSGSW